MPSGSTPPEASKPQLTQWVEMTLPRALAYAMSLVTQRSDAEDLVHDCYMRLLAKSDHYDLPNDGVKLLFRSITHASINWRQRRRHLTSLDSPGVDSASCIKARHSQTGPDQQAMFGELQAAIAEALLTLPVLQRAAIELRSLGHPLTEVAEILELSHGNARVMVHRARQALAVQLEAFLGAERAEAKGQSRG